MYNYIYPSQAPCMPTKRARPHSGRFKSDDSRISRIYFASSSEFLDDRAPRNYCLSHGRFFLNFDENSTRTCMIARGKGFQVLNVTFGRVCTKEENAESGR